MAVTVRKRDIGAERTREGVFLLGAYDGINRVFSLPEAALHDPPRRQVRVYHGGRRLQPVEYEVSETFPGSGYIRVRTIFAPQNVSKLYADYVAAT